MNQIKLSHDTPVSLHLSHMIWLSHPDSKAVIMEIQRAGKWFTSLSFTPGEAKEVARILVEEAVAVEAAHQKAFNRSVETQP